MFSYQCGQRGAEIFTLKTRGKQDGCPGFFNTFIVGKNGGDEGVVIFCLFVSSLSFLKLIS